MTNFTVANQTLSGEFRDGTYHSLELDDAAAATFDSARFSWTHMLVSDLPQARQVLEKSFQFHELAVEDALSNEERPNAQTYEDFLFLVCPYPEKEVEFVEVSFFVRNNSLVTITLKECSHLLGIYNRWKNKMESEGENASDLLHSILDEMVDAYHPIIDRFDDEIDSIADHIFLGDQNQLSRLLKIKRTLLNIRRQLVPTRDVINSLLRKDVSQINNESRPYFQDVYDHVLRNLDTLDIMRETIASTLDVHLSTVSNNLNRVVKKMTVVSTVLMVMTLVAGIYGMNFRFMPELEWLNGYYFALGLMGALAMVVVVVFWRIKWL